jgi:aryl-phospho-beta-D-glucosidase BglC (GH1 family)
MDPLPLASVANSSPCSCTTATIIAAFTQYLQAWDNVLTIFGGKWNVMGLDLKNEPHSVASWEAKKPATDWNRAAEAIAGHVAHKHPDFKGLFFVEGIDHPTNTGTGSNRAPLDKHSKPWGGDFEGVHARAIDLGRADLNDRVVYSPHVVRHRSVYIICILIGGFIDEVLERKKATIGRL